MFLGLWILWLHLRHPKARLAESNYQANRIRLEQFASSPSINNLFIGSSITGRLLPEYFAGTVLEGMISLGLDGSGPALGLELASEGRTLPKRLWIESNLLPIPPSDNDALLRESIQGFGFKLALWIPWLRTETRPSSLLYDSIKGRSIPTPPSLRTPEILQDSSARTLTPPAQASSNLFFESIPKERRLAHRDIVRGQIARLKSAGVELILIRYPQGGVDANPANRERDLADDIAKEFSLPQIELAQLMVQAGALPQFTDGTHLTAGSAKSAAQRLAQELTSISNTQKKSRE